VCASLAVSGAPPGLEETMLISEIESKVSKLLDGVARTEGAAARRDILAHAARMIDGTPLNQESHPVRLRWIALVSEEVAR
jgi:hypothetical protein